LISLGADATTLRIRRECIWCAPSHVIEDGDPGAPTSHGMCPVAEARERAKMPGGGARAQRHADQIASLVTIINAMLAARAGTAPITLAQMPPDEVRRALDHAARCLAERDLVKVTVALRCGHEALCLAVEDLLLGGVRQLTPAQREAYRIVWRRALTIYQGSLEGYLPHYGGAL